MVDQHQRLSPEMLLNYELAKLTQLADNLSRAQLTGPSPEVSQTLEAALKEIGVVIDILARAARGMVKFEASSAPLKERLEEVICRLTCGSSRQVSVENNVSERLHVFTFWDPMNTVLEICLSNAIVAAARERDGRLVLGGNFNEPKSEYTIEIRNTGHIPDDVLEAILHRRPVLSKTGDYGIGLVIANSLLDLLGGRLKITNFGKGVITRLTIGDMRWPLES